MTLEQQVTNLELSKRLKELGVPQKSLFIWILTGGDKNGEHHTRCVKNNKSERCKNNDWISAFTCSELGEIIFVNGNADQPVPWFSSGSWWFYGNNDKEVECDTEADARAKMLIYILEHKLITL